MNIASPLPKVALIAGPTASGKSALALALAEQHRGTIINADSAQVYADLRVVTARPTAAEEAQAPHRLFGHVDAADAAYSAARWAAEARHAIADALAAGRLPILAGGTGLYIRTLLDGIAPVPEIDPEVRAAVRAMPVAEAHAALRLADPEAAARLHPADTTRVARALEVVRSSGRPLTAWQASRTGGIAGAIDLRAAVLMPPVDWLDTRIAARAAAMVADGSAEVAALLARADVPADAPILRAIGVPTLAARLHDRLTAEAAATELALTTRRYAKRQRTWLRQQIPADWMRIEAIENDDRIGVVASLLR